MNATPTRILPRLPRDTRRYGHRRVIHPAPKIKAPVSLYPSTNTERNPKVLSLHSQPSKVYTKLLTAPRPISSPSVFSFRLLSEIHTKILPPRLSPNLQCIPRQSTKVRNRRYQPYDQMALMSDRCRRYTNNTTWPQTKPCVNNKGRSTPHA